MALIASDERLEQSLRAADAAVAWARSMYKVSDDPTPESSSDATTENDLADAATSKHQELLKSAEDITLDALASADGTKDDLDWRALFEANRPETPVLPREAPRTASRDVLSKSMDALDAAQLAHRCTVLELQMEEVMAHSRMMRAKANEELEFLREQHQRELEAMERQSNDKLAKLQEALEAAERDVRVMKQSEGAVLAQAERERLKAFRMAEPLEAQIVMLREQAVLRGADTERLRASFEAEKRGLVQDLEQVKAHMLEVNKTREESDAATRTLREENMEQKLTIRRLAAEAEQLREALTEAAKRRPTPRESLSDMQSIVEPPIGAQTSGSTARSPGSMTLGGNDHDRRRLSELPGVGVPKIDLTKTDEIAKILDEEEIRYRDLVAMQDLDQMAARHQHHQGSPERSSSEWDPHNSLSSLGSASVIHDSNDWRSVIAREKEARQKAACEGRERIERMF